MGQRRWGICTQELLTEFHRPADAGPACGMGGCAFFPPMNHRNVLVTQGTGRMTLSRACYRPSGSSAVLGSFQKQEGVSHAPALRIFFCLFVFEFSKDSRDSNTACSSTKNEFFPQMGSSQARKLGAAGWKGVWIHQRSRRGMSSLATAFHTSRNKSKEEGKLGIRNKYASRNPGREVSVGGCSK